MWAFIKSLLTQWAVFKVLLKALGSLAWLVPIALVLKAIGLPMLMLLLALALPIFIVLALFGLPFILVAIFGTLLMVGLFALLSIGFTVLKIAIPIIIIVWLVRWVMRNGRNHPKADPTTES